MKLRNVALAIAAGTGILLAYQASRTRSRLSRNLAVPQDIIDLDGDIAIGFIGDSLAFGLGADKYEDTPGYKVASHFGARYINLSKCGAVSSDLLFQSAIMSKFKPDIVVIFIGTNDITHGQNLLTCANHVETSISVLRNAGIHVLFVPCVDLHVVYSIGQPLRKILGVISQKYSQYQASKAHTLGAVVIDQGAILRHFTHDKMFSIDKFHPSSQGYSLIAEHLIEEISKVLPPPPAAQA